VISSGELATVVGPRGSGKTGILEIAIKKAKEGKPREKRKGQPWLGRKFRRTGGTKSTGGRLVRSKVYQQGDSKNANDPPNKSFNFFFTQIQQIPIYMPFGLPASSASTPR
jgi:hypothetical protein